VPGASVTVTTQETQVASKWVSGPRHFTAPFLQPGEYEVARREARIQALGATRITLSVPYTSRIDVTLESASPPKPSPRSRRPRSSRSIPPSSAGDQSKEIDELPLNSQTGRTHRAHDPGPGAFRTNPVGLFDAPQGNSSSP